MSFIKFRVDGIPLGWPKENNRGGQVYQRDKPIRKRDQVTGELLKTPQGEQLMQPTPRAEWTRAVQKAAIDHMQLHNLEPYGKQVPLLMGCLFFMPRIGAWKRKMPMAGDLDNYEYVIWNALKHSPTFTRFGRKYPGRYPKGICYYDDNQIVWRLPGGRLWANAANPPGVIVIIEPFNLCDTDTMMVWEATMEMYLGLLGEPGQRQTYKAEEFIDGKFIQRHFDQT